MTLSPVKAGYTGHEHDAELGLVNMKGRIYDPFTRRFLTPDPYVTDPLNPQGLNRFSYVRNNPLNLVDPTGFSGEGGGCDNNCGGGPEGGIVIMPEIVITASAPTTYVNTNANVNQSSSGSFNANGFSASGFNISSLGEGTGNSSGSGNAAISDGRMTGGYYSPQMSGGDNRGGDFQAVANQNPSSNPQAGTETGSTQQPTDNRTASPAPETSGSNRAWVGARIASAAIPFASSVMTMNDPNATDEEKGEALIWTLVDAATLGVGHAVAAIVQLGRAAKSGKTALTAAHLGLSGKGIAKLTGTVVDAGSTRIINVGYIEATSRGALTGEARTAFSNMLSSARAEGIQTLQINATFANAGLQEFAASMAAQYGGTFSSAGGVETLTFMLK